MLSRPESSASGVEAATTIIITISGQSLFFFFFLGQILYFSICVSVQA